MNKFHLINRYIDETFLIVDLYLSAKCNLDCWYCYLKHYDYNDKKYLSLEQYKNIIKLIRLSKYKINLCLLGGEPTLYNNLQDLIDYSKNIGIEQVEIFTNGTNDLSKYHLYGASRFVISIHANYFEKYEDKIIKNLQFLIDNKINYQLKIMMDKNYKNFLFIYNKLKKYHPIADYIHLKNDVFDLGEKQLEIENQKTYYYKNKKYSLYDIIKNQYNKSDNLYCFQNEVSIRHNGLIEPFCARYTDNINTNPLFFKNYTFKFRKCLNGKGFCNCFEQVKYHV